MAKTESLGNAFSDSLLRPGVYNVDYFSGSQVAVYLGDIFVDEVTSISFEYQQTRRPLYGYASTLYDALTKGQVLVQGSFTINFKEAGYLWLILQRHSQINPSTNQQKKKNGAFANNLFGDNIEQVNDKMVLETLDLLRGDELISDKTTDLKNLSELAGYSELGRSLGAIGGAEDKFEAFEDLIWGTSLKDNEGLDTGRRCDEPSLNPFDIYITYGDYQGDDTVNHTVIKLAEVSILGKAQQVRTTGEPIQELYSFVARNII